MPALRSPRFTRTVVGWPSATDYTDGLVNMKIEESATLYTIKSEPIDLDETLLELPFPTHSPTSGRRHHTRKRPEGYIPRPRNAFVIYRSELCASGKIPPCVERQHGEISRVAGVLWNNLPLDQKSVYVEKAAEEKRMHMKMYPDYKYAPVARKNSKVSRKKKEKNDGGKDEGKHLVLAQLLMKGKVGEQLEKAYDTVKKGCIPQIPMPMATSDTTKSRVPVGRPRKATKSTTMSSVKSITADSHFDVGSFMKTEMPEVMSEKYSQSSVYANPRLYIPSSDSSDDGSESRDSYTSSSFDSDPPLEIPFTLYYYTEDNNSGIDFPETYHPPSALGTPAGHANASTVALASTPTGWLNYRDNEAIYVNKNTSMPCDPYLSLYSNPTSSPSLIPDLSSFANDVEEFKEVKVELEPYDMNYGRLTSEFNFSRDFGFGFGFGFATDNINYNANNVNNLNTVNTNSNLAIEQQSQGPSLVDNFDSLDLNSNLGHDSDAGPDYFFADYVDFNHL